MTLKLFIALIAFLVLGDSISTYLCLTQVPGSQEANPLVLPIINWLGVGPTMIISCLSRWAGMTWLYLMAKTGELRRWIVLVGFTFVIALTLFANINNWEIWLNHRTLESHFIS